MVTLATIQKHINKRLEAKRKKPKMPAIFLGPKRSREDLDYTGYILEGKTWKNKQRGNKTKQFNNHL